MRNWLSCKMCLRRFSAILKSLCRWQKRRGRTDGKLLTATGRWLQPLAQMLSCKALSHTVWLSSDKLNYISRGTQPSPMFFTSQTQKLLFPLQGILLPFIAPRRHLSSVCGLLAQEGSSTTLSLTTLVQDRNFIQYDTSTATSTEMFLTQTESAKHRGVHSLSVNHTIKQTKNAQVYINWYTPRWAGLLAGGQEEGISIFWLLGR